MIKRLFIGGVLLLVVAFLLIQVIPYGRDHQNPPVVREVQWSNPEAEQLAQAACFDCHSNETVWPAYASIAPISWLIQRDVVEGRQKLNFSDWGRGEEMEEPEELLEAVEEGEMPPASYLLLHPEARLSEAEKGQLLNGLRELAGGRLSGLDAEEAN